VCNTSDMSIQLNNDTPLHDVLVSIRCVCVCGVCVCVWCVCVCVCVCARVCVRGAPGELCHTLIRVIRCLVTHHLVSRFNDSSLAYGVTLGFDNNTVPCSAKCTDSHVNLAVSNL
jgi:hypothetical protein